MFERRNLALLMACSLSVSLAAHGRAAAAPAEHPRYAEQSGSPKSAKPPAAAPDPNCPGTDNKGLMCRLVNEYRAKNGLKPVQLDSTVSRESQYLSDHFNKWHAC